MSFLWKLIKYYWRPFTAIILIFTVVGISMMYSTQTAETMKIQAIAELDQQWRTDYDLLVSPSRTDAEVPQAENKGTLVRRSDMSDIRGGISLELYEQIKEIDGIEIAAPLSFVGYVAAVDNLSLILPPEEGIYITETETTFFDGLRYRKIPTFNSASSLSEVMYYSKFFNKPMDPEDELFKILFEFPWNKGSMLSLPFRSSYYWSVIGVDPEQEQKLLHLDTAVIEGEYLPNRKYLLSSDELTAIPLLLMNKSYDTHRKLNIGRVIDENLNNYLSDVILYKDELAAYADKSYLKQLPRETFIEVEYNPYGEDYLFFMGNVGIQDGEIVKTPQPIRGGIGLSTYNLSSIEYEQTGELDTHPLYRAIPISTNEEQINYREIESEHKRISYAYDIYGLFDPALLHNPYTTSQHPQPVDFYHPDPVYITHDTQGNRLSERVKYQNPPHKESYTTGGADAITTLAAAKYLLDDDPISVIRVVVEGAGERSKESMAKVERVAEQIRQETGLHVDVMLGAADRKVQIVLEDFEGVPGYGYLLEGWSQAGTSFGIEDRVVTTNILLSSYIMFMGLIGASLVYRNYVEVRRKDILVQYTFGWKRSSILKQLTLEGVLVLLFVALVLLLCKLTIGLSWGWVQFGNVSVFLLLIASFSILFLYIRPLMKRLDQHLNLRESGQVILSVRTGSPSLTLWGYLGKNLIRYGMGSLLKLLILLTTVIYVFLFLITKGGSSSFLILTFLGENIDLMLEPYQWVLFSLGLILSIGSYMALQVHQMEKRTQEIQLFQAWGWRKRRWVYLYMLEELTITGTAVLLGIGLGIGLLKTLASAKVLTPLAIGLLAASSILFTLLALALALSTRSKHSRLREFN